MPGCSGDAVRRFAGVMAGLALVCAATSAMARDFPAAPVKIICDSAPGSANDVTARVLAERLGAIWSQQVIVVNAPGAGGAIAARMAAAAAPDGYTLFMPVTSEFYALEGAPDVAANLPLRLDRDFRAVGFVNSQPLFIGASFKAGFTTPQEMVDAVRARPGALSYATSGRGRLTHLAMELLQSRTGLKLQMISYVGGSAQAMPDVTSGRVELVLDAYAGLAPAFKGALLRGLATTSRKRAKAFPDIPAVSEVVPDFDVIAWGVLVAPPATPDDLVAAINVDLNKALADPGLIERFAANGGETRQMTPAQTTGFVRAEQARWLPVLARAMKIEP